MQATEIQTLIYPVSVTQAFQAHKDKNLSSFLGTFALRICWKMAKIDAQHWNSIKIKWYP